RTRSRSRAARLEDSAEWAVSRTTMARRGERAPRNVGRSPTRSTIRRRAPRCTWSRRIMSEWRSMPSAGPRSLRSTRWARAASRAPATSGPGGTGERPGRIRLRLRARLVRSAVELEPQTVAMGEVLLLERQKSPQQVLCQRGVVALRLHLPDDLLSAA